MLSLLSFYFRSERNHVLAQNKQILLDLEQVKKRAFTAEVCTGAGACPGIRKGGGAKIWKPFFFLLFNFLGGGGPAQEIAEKMIFPTEKVAKYRWNSLNLALMAFFFVFQFLGGGPGPLGPPPPGHAPEGCTHYWVVLTTWVYSGLIINWVICKCLALS